MSQDVKIAGVIPFPSRPGAIEPAAAPPRAEGSPVAPVDQLSAPPPLHIELQPKPTLPGLGADALAPAESSGAVPVTLYWDDPLEAPVTVNLPRGAFGWRDGRPVLEGPRVRIVLEDEADLGMPTLQFVPGIAPPERTVRLALAPVEANPDGALSPEEDGPGLGQTTPFVATHQVITLAEKAAGRRILWGDGGQLSVEPYARISPLTDDLNAFFSPAFRTVSMGSLAAVKDGQLEPYSGSGVDFIDYTIDDARAELREVEGDLAARAPDDPRRPELEAVADAKRMALDVLARLRTMFATAQPEQESLLDLMREVASTGLPDKPATPAPEPEAAPPDDGHGMMRPPSMAAAFALLSEMQGVVSVIARAVMATRALNPVDEALVELPKSREVAAHEAGHAALGTLKPGLRSVAGMALHEAYGDLVAFWTAFDKPGTAEHWLDETGGDFQASSPISRIGEQFRQQLARATKDPDDDHLIALRDLSTPKHLSDFPGVTLDTRQAPLPTDGEVAGSHESHQLSQLLSSTLYELFADEVAASLLNPGGAETEATVIGVRDRVAELVHKSLLFVPEDGGSLGDLVAALRYTNTQFALVDGERLDGILEERGLLRETDPRAISDLPAVQLPPDATSAQLRTVMSGPGFQQSLTRLTAESDGELVLEEDWTDDRGYRVLRFRGEPAGWQPFPGASKSGAWAERYGAHLLDALKPRASMVFDASGNLVALHPLDAASAATRPATLHGCGGFH